MRSDTECLKHEERYRTLAGLQLVHRGPVQILGRWRWRLACVHFYRISVTAETRQDRSRCEVAEPYACWINGGSGMVPRRLGCEGYWSAPARWDEALRCLASRGSEERSVRAPGYEVAWPHAYGSAHGGPSGGEMSGQCGHDGLSWQCADICLERWRAPVLMGPALVRH